MEILVVILNMKRLFWVVFLLLFFVLLGCNRSFDEEAYVASLLNFEEQMAPDVLFEGFVFVDTWDVLLEDILISYSDLSLYLNDGEFLLEQLENISTQKDIYSFAEDYYREVQRLYQEELNDYVMQAAALFRRHEEVSHNQELLDLKTTIKEKLAISWKGFAIAYDAYLDRFKKEGSKTIE